jgi:four helix bundle protein
VVWQKAMDLVEKVYVLTEKFPNEEKFGLTSQMRRAAVSIPANIAEGHGRKYTNAYQNHLSIASGSLMELETLLQVSKRLGLIENEAQNLLLVRTDEVGKMLSGLRTSLGRSHKIPDPGSQTLNPES